jgi:PAS domain S-box-containing protein
MEITTTEIESLYVKGNDKLSLIIDAKLLTLTGPWHFEEDEIANAKVDLNKIHADFNYLINVMGCNNLMHPDDYDYSKNLLEELESGKSVDYHFKVITPQAEVKQIHGYGSLLSRESLHARIADWDETTSTLELHLKVFKYAEEVADTCSWTWNVETNTIHCSDNCYRLLGLQPLETPPKLEIFSQYIHTADLSSMKEAVQLTLETFKPVNIEFRVVRTDSELRYFKAKGEIFTTRKNERYFIGSAQDITEQKISEQKIKEAHSLLQSTFDASLNVIQVLNAIRDSNNEITGFERLLHNRLFVQACDLDERLKETIALEPALLEKYKTVVLTGKPVVFDYEYNVEGKTKWYSISVVKLNDGVLTTAEEITDRKINEEQIKEHAHFIERVTSITPDFIVVYDFKLQKYIYVNKKLDNVIGLAENEFHAAASVDFLDIIHPDDFQSTLSFIESLRHASDDDILENTLRIKHVSGNWLWFHTRGVVFKRDESGAVTQFMGINQNITEKKIAEEILLHKEELLAGVLNAPNVNICAGKAIRNDDGEIVDYEFVLVSRTFEEFHERRNLTGERIFEVFPETSKQERERWRRVVETGVSESAEISFPHNGHTFWFGITYSKFGDGIINVWKDITKKKKAAIEVEQQKEQLQKILDAIPQMVWVYNVKTKQYFFNDRWYSYTGLTPEKCDQFDHMNSDVFHPSQKPEITLKWQQYIEAGNPYSGEALIRNSEGTFRWHLDLSIPIRNKSYEVECWVGTFTDVHEQFLAEKKLKENNELLEAIFNSSINGIQVLDAVHQQETGEVVDFTWKYCNAVTQKIWRAKNLIGKRLGKEFPIVYKNGMFDKMKTVIDTGVSVQFELRYSYNRDSHMWFDISIVKLEDGVVLTFQDITDRKNAEIELQKSKHFILQITNSTPDIIYVLDVLTENVVYVSSKVRSVFGMHEDFIYNQSSIFTKVLHPDDFGKRMHQLQELASLSEDQTREIEVRLKVADGSYHWFKIRDTLFKRKENGKAWLTIGLVQDINEKKIAEEKIFIQHQIDRQSERLANIGTWQWNLRTGNMKWVDNLYQLLECDPKVEPSHEAFIESIHPQDRAVIAKESERMEKLPDGPLAFYDFRVIKKDGGIRHLRSVSELITRDGERYAIGAVRDVTYDILLQRALAERIDFTEALIESSIDRIIVIDKDYRVLTWNKSCEEVYKLKKQEVMGKHLFRVFPEIDKNTALIEKFQRALTGELIHLNNVNGFYYDGYYEAFLIPLKNQANEVYGILSILHDITQHINAQHQMQKLNDELRQRNLDLKSLNDELSTFAFIASHDLREPLRKIQVFSQALVEIENGNLSDRGKEYFKRMTAAVDRMNNLIDSILAFSRTTASSKQIELLSLNDILLHVIHEYNDVIEEKKVLVEHDALPDFTGNALQFTQLFQQIIGNSLKFQQGDVVPTIRITSEFLSGEEINDPYAIREKQYLKLEVTDNGIGFDQKYAGKIFQMFQRLHTLSEFPGTGMGLAICKKIVENHGGFMVAKSNPGDGAVFTCYFPVERMLLK